ncbi:amino acid ABC transporter permease, partial [Streptococcus pneumoniae]
SFAVFYYVIMTSIWTVAMKACEKSMGQVDKK